MNFNNAKTKIIKRWKGQATINYKYIEKFAKKFYINNLIKGCFGLFCFLFLYYLFYQQ